jgi:hypothetical protein
LQVSLNVLVDENRLAEALAAVDHPVTDGIDLLQAFNKGFKRASVGLAVGCIEFPVSQQSVVGAKQTELQAARAGIDYKYPQLDPLEVGPGQTQ